jgi:Sigma-70, region 4
MSHINTAMDALVGELATRQKNIIISRFGIQNKKRLTLARLGDRYGITRERVRQIEDAALKNMRGSARKDKDLASAHAKLVSHSNELGGVRTYDELAKDAVAILSDPSAHSGYVELLFGIFGTPKLHKESRDFYAFWYTTDKALTLNKAFVKKIAQLLGRKKDMVIERKAFDSLLAKEAKGHALKDMVALNLLSTSKKFSTNVFGDFGLTHWPEITPKTVRDKSYLVVKKRGTALHFRDIAKAINEMKFDAKKAHPQTVHNEVIRDRRFVLVGRGMYSLKEFGIEDGTTKELIHRILKKNGPMHSRDIITLVSKQRMLQPNTIVLSLQDKTLFKKTDKGIYHIA